MAIDYDSGAGLFDKVGVVVSMVNAIETWELGTLETNMGLLETELEDSKVYDRLAKNLMYAKWNNYKTALDNMKARYTELVRLLMASEMVYQQFLTDDSLQGLCQYLEKRMLAVDTETLKRSARTTAANPSYLTSITASILGVFSVKGPASNTSALSENGAVPHDTIHVKVADVVTYLQEKLDIYGSVKPKSDASPQYAYAGNLAKGFVATRFRENRNLLVDSNFQNLNAQGQLANWVVESGTWGTDLASSYSNPVFDGPKSVLFSDDGTISQVIPSNKFKPNTLYLLILAYDVSDVNPSDGNMLFGFVNDAQWYATQAVAFGATTSASSLVMSTGDYVPDLMKFSVSRSGSSAGQVRVNNIGIYEMQKSGNLWWLVSLAPRTSAMGLATPRILGEDQIIALTNDHAGLFQNWFLRFTGTQLPTSGSPSIADALAS